MSEPTRLSAIKRALVAEGLWEERGWAAASEPLAIVGMACRFPGGVDSPDALWDLLIEGGDLVKEVPRTRWPIDEIFDEDPSARGKISTRWGAFFDDVSGFDAAFFGITPAEAERMDPQQRLALEVSWEALEHAGIDPDTLRDSNSGVFFSSYHSDYARLQYGRIDTVGARTLTGALHSVLPNRLSHFLGLHGPSLNVDTACSSSLVAMHLASQSLRLRECDLAIVGGVNLMITPDVTVALSKGGFMSPTGHCHTFSDAADGFVRGEGCSVVVLRRLSNAIRDGDRILAIVRGSAVNHDGTSTTLSAPNGRAQAGLVRTALERSGVDADDVTFVETHGTGTEIGDPIETDALAEVFSHRDATRDRCLLGALKANLGHTEAAAGVSGVIKTVLCMMNRAIPGQIHVARLNPHIRFDGTPFDVPTETTPWAPKSGPRLAGVSSFGVGGTNGHVVLEECPPELLRTASPGAGPWLLPVSARTPEALHERAAQLEAAVADSVGSDPATSELHGIVVAAARRRSHHRPYRAVVHGASAEELTAGLASLREPGAQIGIADDTPDLCFVFSGQGVQFPGMSLDAMESDPVFAEAMTRLDARGQSVFGWSVLEELRRPGEDSRLSHTDRVQPCLFAIQVALFEALDHSGVRATRVLGHSVGEIAAAHVAGLLDEDTALRVVAERGRAMAGSEGEGGMVALRATEEDSTRILESSGISLDLAAVNGPDSVVLSGPVPEIDALVEWLTSENATFRRLAVEYAFHSRRMDAALERLRADAAWAESMSPRDDRSGCPEFVSTVTGERQDRYSFDDLCSNVRSTVRFRDAVETVIEDGVRHFVELGPHPALGTPILETSDELGPEAVVGYVLHRERPAAETLPALLGSVYRWGCALDWEALYPGPAPHVSLPTYPWHHRPYWIEGVPHGAAPIPYGRSTDRPDGELPLSSVPDSDVDGPVGDLATFDVDLADSRLEGLQDHVIDGAVWLPGVVTLDLFRTASEKAGFEGAGAVEAVELRSPVEIDGVERMRVTVGRVGEDVGSLTLHVDAGDGEWAIAAVAERRPLDGSSEADPSDADSPQSEPIEAGVFYDRLDEIGFQLGPNFRRVERLRVAGNEGIADIRIDAARTVRLERLAWLDSCTHICLGVLSADSDGLRSGPMLPVAVDRYVWLREPTGALRGVAQLRERTSDGARFDVTLVESTGEVVAQILGLRLTRAELGERHTLTDRWELRPLDEHRPVESRSWLVLCGDSSLTSAVKDELASRSSGDLVVESAEAFLSDPDAALPTSESPAGVIFVGPMSDADPVEGTAAALRVLRQVVDSGADLSEPPRIVAVTRAQQTTGWGVDEFAADGGIAGASLLGLLRAVSSEMPEVHCLFLDLPGWPTAYGHPEGQAVEAAWIVDEALHATGPSESAIRDGVRLERVPGVQTLERHRRRESETGHRLVLDRPGTLDGLSLVPSGEPREPEAGELRIRIESAGVNFRDVLTALDLYPGEPAIGHECSGWVEAVGDGVDDLAVGDRVWVFWPGCFDSTVTAPRAWVHPAPATLDPATSASIPIAVATAYHAVCTVGELGSEHSILIHSAAGGVGLAAVRWARARGARVFATAGTQAKRDFVLSEGAEAVFDSRSPGFEDAVLERTGGEGVDVVLNSLTGELLSAGLRSVRPGGCFVELGKRELLSPQEVEAIAPGRRYHAFDLRDVGEESPDTLRRAFEETRRALESATIAPLPVRTAPLSNASSLLGVMAKAEHIGKLVLVPEPTPVELDDLGWIVVSGGLGGIGRATARWLRRHGARHIAVLGRTAGAADLTALDGEGLNDGGELRAIACDVSDPEQVERALHSLREEGIPISGVVHAAGVVRDGLVGEIDREALAEVFAPKVEGAMNLDRATRSDPIRLFWMYSAAGPTINATGQGSYAAANACVDALALRRRASGLPATSVRWGPWADVGMASRLTEDHRARWSAEGLEFWTESTAASAFEALRRGAPTVCYLVRRARRRVAQVEYRESSTSSTGSDLRERIAALPHRRRTKELLREIASVLTAVLGRDGSEVLDVPFRDLGLDSLGSIELRNRLGQSLDLRLPATLAFDHPTGVRLSEYLLLRIEEEETSVDASDAEDHSAIDHLSVEDAEALLLRELEEIEGAQSGGGAP